MHLFCKWLCYCWCSVQDSCALGDFHARRLNGSFTAAYRPRFKLILLFFNQWCIEQNPILQYCSDLKPCACLWFSPYGVQWNKVICRAGVPSFPFFRPKFSIQIKIKILIIITTVCNWFCTLSLISGGQNRLALWGAEKGCWWFVVVCKLLWPFVISKCDLFSRKIFSYFSYFLFFRETWSHFETTKGQSSLQTTTNHQQPFSAPHSRARQFWPPEIRHSVQNQLHTV